jgi:N5-(cytidine 5'-diphosphoramidyl)-L-glutamine hydrolase
MKLVAVTQRVAIEPRYGERRDCLDQAWTQFLLACDLIVMPLPNDPHAAQALCDSAPVAGIVLTGGNDLASYGGDAPERDATETALLAFAEQRALPVLGVCRGMQVIQDSLGVALSRVEGHVARRQTIAIEGERVEVNSFHTFGTRENCPPFDVWGVADDGIIKAIRHPDGRTVAIMWHPERRTPFAADDIRLVRRHFGNA